MTHGRSDILGFPRSRCGVVATAIETLVRAELAARCPGGPPALVLTCDLPITLELPLSAAALEALLAPLVRAAIEATLRPAVRAGGPVLREIFVTAVDVGWAVEIEVACAGPEAVGHEEFGTAVPAQTRIAVGMLAGTLWSTRCPEGGTAVTIRLPREAARTAAA